MDLLEKTIRGYATETKEQAERNEAVMLEWDEKLNTYPKWICGGDELSIEEYGDNAYRFSAVFRDNPQAVRKAVEEYRHILLACRFREAGQYPNKEQLYKRVNGVVYNVDIEHCFEGDDDCASIGFYQREPHGGFDYIKPKPKKKFSLKDLFKGEEGKR